MSATNHFAGGAASENVSASRMDKRPASGKPTAVDSTEVCGESKSAPSRNTRPAPVAPACKPFAGQPAAGGLTDTHIHAESDITHRMSEVVEAEASPSAHFAGGGAASDGPTGQSVNRMGKALPVPAVVGADSRSGGRPACKPSHDRCPRCRNRGYYMDQDERFRKPLWTRCDCPAGDPELDD